ncbi:MAG: hypothetical protein L3J26_01685 [Candidatus Polarisedimenticolaceae bacterium]|nr:hypothetical protein [Candidatus Polarisedimenticolaceae bacterium]
MPGVVLLEHVAQAMAAWQPGAAIAEFPVVKFHQVLRPGQPFGIRLQQREENKFDFKCDVAGQIIASGTFMTDNITAS